MHVCLTGPKTCPPEIGGIEVFTFELGKRLAARGVRVSLVCAQMEGQKKCEEVDGIEVLRIPAQKNRLVLKPSILPGMYETIRKCRPDVIHANDGLTGFLTSFAFSRKRTVVTVHGIGFSRSDWPTPFRQGIMIYQTASIMRAGAVTTTDTTTACSLSGYRNDIKVIPSGVDTSVFRKGVYARPVELPEGSTNILYVGRFIKGKGFDLFLDSIGLISSSVLSKANFVLIGNGKLADVAKERMKKTPSVRWLGEIPHGSMPPYFGTADLLVVPSRSEGLPMSLLEAMSSEVPVVCTLVGGIRAYFDERHVTPITKMSPEGVARAIEEALSDESKTKRRVEAAKELVQRDFSWNSVAEKYLAIYENLVAAS